MNSIKKNNPRMVATEIFTSGVCNLKCDYCYIPKNKEMEKYHNMLKEKIKDGTFIENLKTVYGEDLGYLGLWGTEPTLVMDTYIDSIEDYFNAFPNLTEISFSTNLYAYPEKIVEFTKKIESLNLNREVFLKWQVSLDGQKSINDKSRGEGTTEKIVFNTKKYFDLMKDVELKNVSINFSFKPTLSIENIIKMNKDFNLLREWFEFFDDLTGYIRESTKEVKYKMSFPYSVTPTIVVPGKYSVQDGKELAYFFKNVARIEKMMKLDENFLPNTKGNLNNYTGRLKGMLGIINEFRNNPTAASCSGGDTSFGLNIEGNLHLCHRTFLFENEKYLNDVMLSDIEDWEVGKFKNGVIQNIVKNLIVNKDSSERELNRYYYITRGYHDNLDMRVFNTFAQIKELAMCGQANSVYLKDDRLCFLLAVFVNSSLSCPMENYLQSGSLHIQPISIVRFFANGAFEQMVKEVIQDWGI